MADIDDLIEELKQKRDELRVKVHLASKDVQDDWTALEKKMDQFADDAKLKETGSGLSEALRHLGDELKLGYERIRDAVKD